MPYAHSSPLRARSHIHSPDLAAYCPRARPLLSCAIAEVLTVAPVLANALKVLVLVPPSRAITVTGRARYARALAHTPTHPCHVARREIDSQSVLNIEVKEHGYAMQ